MTDETKQGNKMELIRAAGLTVFGLVVSAEGVRVMLSVGTGLVGFLTACCGLVAAIMGVIYGWRKLTKQQNQKDNE